MNNSPMQALLKKYQWAAQAVESEIQVLQQSIDDMKREIHINEAAIETLPGLGKSINPEQELAKLGYLTQQYEKLDRLENHLADKVHQMNQQQDKLLKQQQQIKLIEIALEKQQALSQIVQQKTNENLTETLILSRYPS